jgi:hypothetical protein
MIWGDVHWFQILFDNHHHMEDSDLAQIRAKRMAEMRNQAVNEY